MDENIKDTKKKRCFIITPIGDEKSEIRRHIDGIIDEAIVPALGEEYEVRVAHREFELGSINDRVIRNIYDSDLVIANLTQLNPNVMFEIGMRYSFGKPALVIAEEGTRLPFDVIDENTLFYINDPKGAAELRKKIGQFVERIDYGREDYRSISATVFYGGSQGRATDPVGLRSKNGNYDLWNTRRRHFNRKIQRTQRIWCG